MKAEEQRENACKRCRKSVMHVKKIIKILTNKKPNMQSANFLFILLLVVSAAVLTHAEVISFRNMQHFEQTAERNPTLFLLMYQAPCEMCSKLGLWFLIKSV